MHASCHYDQSTWEIRAQEKPHALVLHRVGQTAAQCESARDRREPVRGVCATLITDHDAGISTYENGVGAMVGGRPR